VEIGDLLLAAAPAQGIVEMVDRRHRWQGTPGEAQESRPEFFWELRIPACVVEAEVLREQAFV
jgi:hypothetical protein